MMKNKLRVLWVLRTVAEHHCTTESFPFLLVFLVNVAWLYRSSQKSREGIPQECVLHSALCWLHVSAAGYGRSLALFSLLHDSEWFRFTCPSSDCISYRIAMLSFRALSVGDKETQLYA